MNKRQKKKVGKRARTIINKQNRLNKRFTNESIRQDNRAMRQFSHGMSGAGSVESNFRRLVDNLSKSNKFLSEQKQIDQFKRERGAWLSEKLATLEARYDKKGNLTDNQWMQYERYSNELRMLMEGYEDESGYKNRPKYDDDVSINDDDYGAILKKYHEYIDMGLIKESSILDKYQAAQWFKEQIMTQEEMENAIRQADEWKDKRDEKARLRREARIGLITI